MQIKYWFLTTTYLSAALSASGEQLCHWDKERVYAEYNAVVPRILQYWTRQTGLQALPSALELLIEQFAKRSYEQMIACFKLLHSCIARGDLKRFEQILGQTLINVNFQPYDLTFGYATFRSLLSSAVGEHFYPIEVCLYNYGATPLPRPKKAVCPQETLYWIYAEHKEVVPKLMKSWSRQMGLRYPFPTALGRLVAAFVQLDSIEMMNLFNFLERCIEEGAVEDFKQYIEGNLINLNFFTDYIGCDPLINTAVRKNSAQIVQLLCSYGITPYRERRSDGVLPFAQDRRHNNALVLSAISNSREAMKVLLDYGVPVDTKSSGETALHVATRYGFYKQVDLLLRYGADPNLRESWDSTSLGDTALHKAVQLFDTDVKKATILQIIACLLKNDANPDLKNRYGHTLLHQLCSGYASGSDALNLVVTYSRDLNIQAPGGLTAAHYAAGVGDVNSLKILKRHGADLTIKDHKKRTARDLALEREHMTCFLALA